MNTHIHHISIQFKAKIIKHQPSLLLPLSSAEHCESIWTMLLYNLQLDGFVYIVRHCNHTRVHCAWHHHSCDLTSWLASLGPIIIQGVPIVCVLCRWPRCASRTADVTVSSQTLSALTESLSVDHVLPWNITSLVFIYPFSIFYVLLAGASFSAWPLACWSSPRVRFSLPTMSTRKGIMSSVREVINMQVTPFQLWPRS